MVGIATALCTENRRGSRVSGGGTSKLSRRRRSSGRSARRRRRRPLRSPLQQPGGEVVDVTAEVGCRPGRTRPAARHRCLLAGGPLMCDRVGGPRRRALASRAIPGRIVQRANGGVDCDPTRRLRRYTTQSRQDRRAAAPAVQHVLNRVVRGSPTKGFGSMASHGSRSAARTLPACRSVQTSTWPGPWRAANGRVSSCHGQNRHPRPGCAPPSFVRTRQPNHRPSPVAVRTDDGKRARPRPAGTNPR